jgi:hypothetical protein
LRYLILDKPFPAKLQQSKKRGKRKVNSGAILSLIYIKIQQNTRPTSAVVTGKKDP